MDITRTSQTWAALSQNNHKESQSRFGQPFDEAVILLHQVVEVFDLPELYTVGKEPSGFEISHHFGMCKSLLLTLLWTSCLPVMPL
jgi:hypothetical protein